MDNKVEHVNFKDEVSHRVMLRKLADDDRLKGCVIVCMWDDNNMTTGWSKMKPSMAALGVLTLQNSILKSVELTDG